MAKHAYTPAPSAGNPLHASRGQAAKRTRPTLAAFNAMQAERDAARESLGNLIAEATENTRRVATMREGLQNVWHRIVDMEGGICALRLLTSHQMQNASAGDELTQRVEHAQDWVLRHLVEEVAQASETADDAKLCRPTTNRGPLPGAVKGGAA